jgi:hypothetical protein
VVVLFFSDAPRLETALSWLRAAQVGALFISLEVSVKKIPPIGVKKITTTIYCGFPQGLPLAKTGPILPHSTSAI